jgi:hypothetical protein
MPNENEISMEIEFNKNTYLLYFFGQRSAFCSKYEKIKKNGKTININHGAFIKKLKASMNPIKIPEKNVFSF